MFVLTRFKGIEFYLKAYRPVISFARLGLKKELVVLDGILGDAPERVAAGFKPGDAVAF
jgi:hypothetical protein